MESILPLTIGIVTAFIALTAIGGGVAILVGLDKFPLEWLHITPFKNYTIPAFILVIGRGGSSLAATILYFTFKLLGCFNGGRSDDYRIYPGGGTYTEPGQFRSR